MYAGSRKASKNIPKEIEETQNTEED